jgi:hypothetical protein
MAGFSSGDRGRSFQVLFVISSVEDYNTRIINSADDRLDFVTKTGGPVLTINADKVGIGAMEPKAKLHVDGDMKV